MKLDYSKKESWTLEQLELTLTNYTVLEEYEKGNFSRLWQVKLALEEVVGSTIEPSNISMNLVEPFEVESKYYGCFREDMEEPYVLFMFESDAKNGQKNKKTTMM